MFKNKNLIPGRRLLARLGIDIPELSYLTIKFGLTVLEGPKKSWFRNFRQLEYRRIDSEEVLEIIQYDAEKLDNGLFLLSEIEKIPPPAIKPKKDNRPSRRVEEMPRQESQVAESTNSYGQTFFRLDPGDKLLLKDAIEDHEEKIRNSHNVFSLLGAVWFIKFKNEEWGLYPDREKYRYIACVLSLCEGNPESYDSEYSIYNFTMPTCLQK
jgi:hypothetical protein